MPRSLIIQTLKNIPDLLALHASNPKRYPHLLTSNAATMRGDETNQFARYDILFACPQQTINSDGEGFLTQLDNAWQVEKNKLEKTNSEKINLPFTGGWFLYLGYELAQQIESGLNLPPAEDGLPIAFATRFPAAIIIDSKTQQAYLICEKQFSDMIYLKKQSHQNTDKHLQLMRCMKTMKIIIYNN